MSRGLSRRTRRSCRGNPYRRGGLVAMTPGEQARGYTPAMSRWRPPRPPSSPYITAAGYRRLEEELKALWDRRREVVVHLAAAAAEGDRSENAEYQYRKKELRGIDARLGYLQRRMPTLSVVDSVPADTGRVFFGATVTLEAEDGSRRDYRIVGSDETDAAQGAISVDSPLARALLGKRVDDAVQAAGEAPQSAFFVLEIRYAEA